VSDPLEFRILGPFEVSSDGRTLEIPAGKPRALLALLLLHPGEVVSVDTLVEELWAERPPPTAAKNVQGYVARLRKALGDGVLVTQAPGYALRVDGSSSTPRAFRLSSRRHGTSSRQERPAVSTRRSRSGAAPR